MLSNRTERAPTSIPAPGTGHGDSQTGGPHIRPGPSATAGPRVRIGLWVVLAATMLGFSIAPLVNNLMGWRNKDYELWYATGRLVLDGGTIYPKDGRPFPFMYPPSCAAMLGIASLAGEH